MLQSSLKTPVLIRLSNPRFKGGVLQFKSKRARVQCRCPLRVKCALIIIIIIIISRVLLTHSRSCVFSHHPPLTQPGDRDQAALLGGKAGTEQAVTFLR